MDWTQHPPRRRRRARTRAPRRPLALRGGVPPDRGRPHLPQDDRQALGQPRHLVTLGVGQLGQRRAPDHRAQGVDGAHRALGIGGAGELARLEHQAAGLPAAIQRPQFLVVGQGAQDAFDQPRTLADQPGGQDRARLVQRRVLDQREQPAFGQFLDSGEELT